MEGRSKCSFAENFKKIERVRRFPVNQRRGNEDWINPLLKRFDLVRKREKDLARDTCWKQIEESELSERIGRLVIEVNRVAGYRVLEMVDFLAPQKIVCARFV